MKESDAAAPYSAFGDLLAQRRLEAGFAKQQELATALGIKQQSVSRWESGQGRPRATEIAKIEKLVGAKPNELLVAAGLAAPSNSRGTEVATATSFDRALPLSALSPDTFESFCTALLSRYYRTLHGDVSRYGGTGSKQHGIDIVAQGPFGTHTFQCKRVNEFGAQKVHTAVAEQTFKADRRFLLLSCVASPKARDAINSHDGWALWDREDITNKLHELSLVDRLDLVDRYFNGQRFDLLGVTEAGPLQSSEDFFKPFLVEGRFFSHVWELVGRENELNALTDYASSESVVVTCLLGAAGSGKSRLLRAAVSELATSATGPAVFFVSATEEVRAHHLDALRSSRGGRKLLIVDDAHERDDLDVLLRYAADPDNDARLLLSLRPYGRESLRNQAANMSLLPPQVQFVELAPPTVESARSLAASILRHCKKPDEAAGGIASATYSTPLVTVLAAQLVARDEIPLALLNNESNLRDYVLSRLQDVITASLVTGQDVDRLRAILRVVALVQPIIPDEPVLLTALNELEGVDKSDASRLMRLLNEAGVLFKRGLRSRLAPDLLADEILRTSYISADGSINERGMRFFEQANANLLKNMFVNLGRLDWRLREGNTEGTKLLERIQPLLRWGNKYDNPHVEAVEAVAYYQPRLALDFAARLIKEKHGDSERVCYMVRNAAYTYDHLDEACDLLWRAGHNDERQLHQNPGHGIRLLKQLAEFQVNKPIGFVEAVVKFALSLLERPASLSGAFSPFTILEGALETEMESTSFSRNTYTIQRYQLSLEDARDVRRQVIDALLRFIASEPLRRAFLAARTISHALNSPMHGGDSIDSWDQEHLQLIRQIVGVVASSDLHPVVLFGLAQSVAWHAHYREGELSAGANAVLQSLERDLRTKTIRVLIDGWGNETWDLRETLENGGLEKYQAQLRRDLLVAYPEPNELLSELESCLIDIAAVAGAGYGAPFIFMNQLLDKAPGLARALLMRDIEVGLNESLTRYVGKALGVAVATDQTSLLEKYLARSESSDEALVQIAEAYVNYEPLRPYLANEASLFRRISESTNPNVLWAASHLIRRVSKQSVVLALDIACSMRFDVCLPATHDVFMWLASSKEIPSAQIADRSRELLEKLETLERVDDHWVMAFLKQSTQRDPTGVVEFVKNRLLRSAQLGGHTYVPLDRAHRRSGLELNAVSAGVRLLRDILDWAVVNCKEPMLAWQFGIAVAGLWGQYDKALFDELLLWMSGGSATHARLVASVLKNAQASIIYDQPNFVNDILEAAELIDEESVDSIRHAIASATTSGVRSTMPGEPFKEDLALEAHCKSMLARMSRASPAYALYDDLLRHAQDGITRQRLTKEAMEQEDEEY